MPENNFFQNKVQIKLITTNYELKSETSNFTGMIVADGATGSTKL